MQPVRFSVESKLRNARKFASISQAKPLQSVPRTIAAGYELSDGWWQAMAMAVGDGGVVGKPFHLMILDPANELEIRDAHREEEAKCK